MVLDGVRLASRAWLVTACNPWRTPVQQGIASIALQFDLTKHGQVPKFCRRTR